MIDQFIDIFGNDPRWAGVALGTLFLIGGWILYWVGIHVWGAVLVGGAGFMIADFIAMKSGLLGSELFVIQIIGVIAGVFLGILAASLVHNAGFFVLGWIVGAAVFYIIVDAGRADFPAEWARSDWFFAFGIPVAGLVMGFLAVMFSRLVVTIISATLGATLLMASLDWPWDGLAIAPVAVLGMVIQLAIARPFRKSDDEEED